MKITIETLKQIINEEIEKVLTQENYEDLEKEMSRRDFLKKIGGGAAAARDCRRAAQPRLPEDYGHAARRRRGGGGQPRVDRRVQRDRPRRRVRVAAARPGRRRLLRRV